MIDDKGQGQLGRFSPHNSRFNSALQTRAPTETTDKDMLVSLRLRKTTEDTEEESQITLLQPRPIASNCNCIGAAFRLGGTTPSCKGPLRLLRSPVRCVMADRSRLTGLHGTTYTTSNTSNTSRNPDSAHGSERAPAMQQCSVLTQGNHLLHPARPCIHIRGW